jgi:hypothetical protein
MSVVSTLAARCPARQEERSVGCQDYPRARENQGAGRPRLRYLSALFRHQDWERPHPILPQRANAQVLGRRRTRGSIAWWETVASLGIVIVIVIHHILLPDLLVLHLQPLVANLRKKKG